MADNTVLNAGTGGDTIATDELTTLNGAAVAGIKAQRVKVGFGADAAFQDVTAAAPLPVSGAFFQATQPVSGTFFQATQPVSIATMPSTPVTGAFFQTTQPVSGAVSVTANSLVSTANSSAVALAANGAFTGTSEDVTEYSNIKVAVFANQASAADGLQLQQSTDGTNWDFVDAYTVPISAGKTFGCPVQAKFFRVVYTNGATANTAFRLQTIYSKQGKQGGAVRPQDARTNDNDFEEVSAYNMVFNGTSWDRARGNATTGTLVSAPPATLAVTATAAANTAVTLTLPAPGAGLFHYITGIEIMRTATAALAGSATLVVTTTNLPGSLAWSIGNAMAAGATANDKLLMLNSPLRSSAANTATTIAMPAPGAAVLWRANAYYYIGP